jgi:hypothetical protein
MAKIAIIGTGIAGLSVSYLLHPKHHITVYEKEARLGGHSRTITVEHGDRIIPVDTGFIVFNERNYPNLTALFRILGVRIKDSDMTYAMTAAGGAFEWGAKNLNTVFGQRRNIVNPRFLKLFGEVMRFNREVAARAKNEPTITLGQLIDAMDLSQAFRQYYLLPMAGAIWSSPPKQMLAFPARVFVTFFENHSLLSMSGQPQWLTVDGGSVKYVQKIAKALGDSVRLNCAATRVERTASGAKVDDATGASELYDHVVLACHSDEALALLADAGDAERTALGAIRYQKNDAILHKDPRFMPKRRRCWASWNYHSDGRGDEPAVTLTYWMNNLQKIDERYPLFVTLNPTEKVPDEHVFDRHVFHHPVFDGPAIAAQARLGRMQGQRNTWFCGAYMRHGFHEDGLVSAMAVAEALGAPAPWIGQSEAKPVEPALVA